MARGLDRLASDCLDMLAESSPRVAVREVVRRFVTDPGEIRNLLGESPNAAADRVLVSDRLTVLNVIWAPRMVLMPHDHRMWAVVGVYAGREDNIFWRRRGDPQGHIQAAGARSLGAGEAHALGREAIHSATNPTWRFTGAIHVYGGDFFGVDRSEWDPETLEERSYDLEKNLRLFEASNAAWTPDAAGARGEPGP